MYGHNAEDITVVMCQITPGTLVCVSLNLDIIYNGCNYLLATEIICFNGFISFCPRIDRNIKWPFRTTIYLRITQYIIRYI